MYHSENYFLKGLTTNQRWSRVVFLGLIFLSVIISIICTYQSIKLVGATFPGFLLNERMKIASIGVYRWSGAHAGLELQDRLIMADGKYLYRLADLNSFLSHKEVGEPVIYTLQRNSSEYDVLISTMRFSWYDLFLTFGITFLGGICYLAIGVVVYVLKPDTMVSWSFFLASFFLNLYSVTVFDMQSLYPIGMVRLYLFASAFFPAAFIHFSFIFPRKWNVVERSPGVQFIPYLFGILIILPLEFLYPDEDFYVFWIIVLVFLIFAAFVVLLSNLWAYMRPSSVLDRQRAKIILFGVAISFPLPAIAYFSQNLYNSFFGIKVQTNFLIFFLMIFPAAIAYAIVKHNLFDVDVFIKRAVGYVIITAFVAGGYLGTQIGVETLLSSSFLGKSAEKVYPIFFALLIVFFFNPINRKIQAMVDRLFFRSKFSYKDTVTSVSTALTSVLNLDEVLNKIIGTVKQEMFIDRAGLILLDARNNDAQFYFSGNPDSVDFEKQSIQIDPEEPLLHLLAEKKEIVTSYDILEDPNYANIREQCKEKFEKIGATLAVPLLFQNDLIGVLSLGTKKSGFFYSRDDISLIETLASQSAVAIKNALLFIENIEKTRMEEELKIAHDIQVEMLPEKLPQLKEATFAAISFPAQEVGGDFYDFIETGKVDPTNRKVDIIVGDVSGKAVSGALVMTASRSIFRLLSEEEGSLSDLVKRANMRLKHDIKKGMFVALVYASFNPTDKTLVLVNAGQTQPILVSRKGSAPRFIENKGDTFPLGIIEDCDYQEICVQLTTGDTVLFYTDGIVEAMNKTDELYGFDRFMDVIEKNRSLQVDELHSRLMADVTSFVGDVVQHDDLTLVIFQVN